MKLINIEKVKAEIEKLQVYANSQDEWDSEDEFNSLERLKDFLDTLPEERQEDVAIGYLLDKGYPIDANGGFPSYEEMYNIIKDGIDQNQKDLEEEITYYMNMHYRVRNDETLVQGNDPLTTFDFERIARHFYNLGLNSKLKDCLKIKGWVARDRNGRIFLYKAKPTKSIVLPEWKGDFILRLDPKDFPEVKWEDKEPTKVELIIKKKLETNDN